MLYLFFFRKSTKFYGERKIFLYHLYSACIFSPLVLILASMWLGGDFLTISFGLIAAHGIYSISFLELWSLAQGSYSITIMAGLHSQHISTRDRLINNFSLIGDEKRSSRIESLCMMRLVNNEAQICRLTNLGRALAILVYCFNRVPNLKHNG